MILVTFCYSFYQKQFFYQFITRIPFLCIAILLFILICILFFKSKKITKQKVFILFMIFCMAFYSIFVYFPFLHLGKVPDFEKQLIEKMLVDKEIISNRKGDWKGDKIVAHSLGEIDGNRVTPSIETFISNYDKGFKTFEVDFVPTSDNRLVCRHLWEDPNLQKGIDENHIPSLEKFKNTPILGQYTPLTYTDLCTILKEYPDAWIITDTKENSAKEIENDFINIVGEAMEVNALNVLNRFVIQIYDKKMYSTIENIYPFKNVIYATYRDWHGDLISFINICKYCNLHGINSISMWNYYYCDEIQEIANLYDLDVYIHTENDLASAQRYLNMGAKGIYTDFIQPNQLR